MRTTRRRFLQLSGLTIAAMPHALDNIMRPEGLRVAIFGLGAAGQNHLAALLKRPEVMFLAACDPDESVRAHVAAELKKTGFQDHQICYEWQSQLVAHRFDLVVVASPDGWHFAQISEALRHGTSVVVETPVVHDWNEWRDLEKLADAAAGRLFISAPWRGDEPATRAACRDWHSSWELGNGVLGREGWAILDQALHGLELVLGRPRRVFAAGSGGPFRGGSGCTPGQLLVTVEFEERASLAWSEREHARSVCVRDSQGRTLRTLGSRCGRTLAGGGDATPVSLEAMWQSIISDIQSTGMPADFRVRAGCPVAATWMAVKAALQSQRTVVLDWQNGRLANMFA